MDVGTLKYAYISRRKVIGQSACSGEVYNSPSPPCATCERTYWDRRRQWSIMQRNAGAYNHAAAYRHGDRDGEESPLCPVPNRVPVVENLTSMHSLRLPRTIRLQGIEIRLNQSSEASKALCTGEQYFSIQF